MGARMNELPGTGWRDIGKRGVRQVRASLELKHQPAPVKELPRTGRGHEPAVCEHQAWTDLGDGTFRCEWCETIATTEELETMRNEPF